MHTVVETPTYLRRAKDCGVSLDERAEIVAHIAMNPVSGDEMPGTGGARKVRFARQGKGKSGGYRIVTFFGGADIPVFLLTVYAKNEASDMTQAGKNELKKILGGIADSYRKRRHEKTKN